MPAPVSGEDLHPVLLFEDLTAMGMEIVIALVIIAGLTVALVIQRTLLTVANRERRHLVRSVAKEREATTDILNLSKNIIHTGDAELFLRNMAKFILRTMNADGAATFKYAEQDFQGCGVAGFFPLLEKVSSQIEAQLLSDPKKYNQFFAKMRIPISAPELARLCSRGYCYYRQCKPDWLPDCFVAKAPVILGAPIVLGGQTVGCIMVVSKDEFDHPRLREDDGCYLGRLGELIALAMEMLEVVKERKIYEEKLRTAREEGMLSISSGIIHNIGNAITVAKLTANELKAKIGRAETRPERLILDQIIPNLEQHVEAGDAQEFLSRDGVGRQYPAILRELTEHLAQIFEKMAGLLQSLETKLEHISSIVELQQAFVGELGTENLTNMARVLESALAILNETCGRQGVTIIREIEPNLTEVLVDPSMMTQVFINLLKNAIEAIETEGAEKDHIIRITLHQEKIGEQTCLVSEISDNGPGIQKDAIGKVFDLGFSTKPGRKTHGVGLHASQEMAKKYGGRIEVSSVPGQGACFKVILPVKA